MIFRSRSQRLSKLHSMIAVGFGSRGPESRSSAASILLVATWFGLITAISEGMFVLVFYKLGWLSWRVLRAVSPEIFWIIPVVDLLLFSALALVLLGVQFFSRRPVMRLLVFLCAFFMVFDWLMLSGHARGKYLIESVLALVAIGSALLLTRWFVKHPAMAVRLSERTWIGVALATVFLVTSVQGWSWLQEARAERHTVSDRLPNVLVIVVDTLRADHLSGYGYSRQTSPNLDHVAGMGVLFEETYAGASWSLPSHASLMTGRYPSEHGAEKGPLDERYPTVGEIFRSRGYRTGAFSGNSFFFCRRLGLARGFIHFDDYSGSLVQAAVRTCYGRALEALLNRLRFGNLPVRRTAPEVNASFLQWVDSKPHAPFFAVLNYFDVHDPYIPPQPYRTMFSKLRNPGGIIDESLASHAMPATPEELQGEIDAYDGAIAFTDDQIGQLLRELEKRHIADNTLIVITSDHGESFGNHGLFIHGNSLYRGQIRVPLVFYWPTRIPTGLRIARPVSNAAVAATVLELAENNQQPVFPVVSLAQLWNRSRDSEWPFPESDLAQLPWNPKAPNYFGAMRSMVGPQFHYIRNEKLGEELYDWRSDPLENHDLAKDSKLGPVLQAFRNSFKQR
ncbi:MAG TPA: sulfatase-like hydrolase/transferase [Candidatus Angelobacter sp.]|nr:sulfatase-like hydrolase/transferase [Candidatus Angelobacter sp.]